MNEEVTYVPSQTLPGDTVLLRKHAYTRWMSNDLLQAAADFCRNIRLVAIYCECVPGSGTRNLFWNPPQGALVEIRSGRSLEQFKEFDKTNIDRGWPLLSLHVYENQVYSAVWISPDHYVTAKAVLSFYGITPAERKAAGE